MQNYIIRRVLLIIPTVFIVSVIVFLTIRLIPGNVVDAMSAQQSITGAGGKMDRAAIMKELGMDKPILVQYGIWAGRIIVHGDLGKDIWTKVGVTKEISSRLPVTIELSLLALLVAQLIALPIGILSALRQDTWGDYISRSFAILCIAIPGFWLGTMLIVFQALWFNYSPPIRYVSFGADPIASLKMFIEPAIILGMGMAGGTMRITRTMMLEVLRQDYIRTAWAKGLRERVVVLRHTLKNALIPVITVIGSQLVIMIGGDVIVEQIFNLPGLGRLLMSAVSLRNYPVVSGVLFVFAIGMVVINLLVDLTYGYLDPRVAYR
jgi:peptide/nickel transport system permease protein